MQRFLCATMGECKWAEKEIYGKASLMMEQSTSLAATICFSFSYDFISVMHGTDR